MATSLISIGTLLFFFSLIFSVVYLFFFFFSSRRRHTRWPRDWSSDVCSSDLSNWMVNGDPGFDVWAMDISRFGDWTSMAYTNAKVRENYSRRFSIRFPNEELPAARPLRTTPVYDRLKAEGAVFGVSFGLEHALWFARDGMKPEEDVTFRRSNAHETVGAECHAVRTAVGLMEISTYAKYEVTGAGAEAWLSQLLVARMPQQGRLPLAPMLNPNGKLIGDFTIAKA